MKTSVSVQDDIVDSYFSEMKNGIINWIGENLTDGKMIEMVRNVGYRLEVDNDKKDI